MLQPVTIRLTAMSCFETNIYLGVLLLSVEVVVVVVVVFISDTQTITIHYIFNSLQLILIIGY